MTDKPRISLVTPSLNQGQYIGEAIESVAAQGYPNLEHIVVDGGSTDGTLEVLRRYAHLPHLRVICEPDRGQADAINKGFRLATGEIFGFLNADDLLWPGALERVAQEVDPGRGRYVVMGRCRFIDEAGRYIGIEHPSRFEGHRRVLEIWKGHTIPQPATFWHRTVWERCGPLDEALPAAWVDYDLFCKFSKYYHFHRIDQVLAAYRLHGHSKTMRQTDSARLEECIRISRRYWGSPFRPMYWRLALSLSLYRLNRTGRARQWLRRADEARRARRYGRALVYGAAGGILAPEVVFYVVVYPHLRDLAKALFRRLWIRYGTSGISAHTEAFLDYTQPWPDGWVGPRLVVAVESHRPWRRLIVRGYTNPQFMGLPLTLTVSVDGQEVGQHTAAKEGDFVLALETPEPWPAGIHVIEVRADRWFVPHRFLRNRDYRPLAWRLGDIETEHEVLKPIRGPGWPERSS